MTCKRCGGRSKGRYCRTCEQMIRAEEAFEVADLGANTASDSERTTDWCGGCVQCRPADLVAYDSEAGRYHCVECHSDPDSILDELDEDDLEAVEIDADGFQPASELDRGEGARTDGGLFQVETGSRDCGNVQCPRTVWVSRFDECVLCRHGEGVSDTGGSSPVGSSGGDDQ